MTEQQFRKKIVGRIVMCMAIFATGLALFLYASLQHGFHIPYSHKEFYIYGVFSGLTIGGLLKAIILGITLKNENLFKNQFIKQNDERNKQISLKAWAWAGYGSIFALMFSTLFLPIEIMSYVYLMMCIPLIIYSIVYAILQDKM